MKQKQNRVDSDTLLLLRALIAFVPLIFLIFYGTYLLVIIYACIGAIIFIIGKYLKLSTTKHWYIDLLFSIVLWPGLLLLYKEVYNPPKKTYLDDFNEIIVNKLASEMQKDPISELNIDGTIEDMMPNGVGRFGYDVSNPIPCDSIFGVMKYLSDLRDKNGDPILYIRVGETRSPNIKHPIEEFTIGGRKGIGPVTIYFSKYQKKVSKKAPDGFYLN